MQKKLERFKQIMVEITDIGRAEALLGWDQQVYMPRGGAEDRGKHSGDPFSFESQEVHLTRGGRAIG